MALSCRLGLKARTSSVGRPIPPLSVVVAFRPPPRTMVSRAPNGHAEVEGPHNGSYHPCLLATGMCALAIWRNWPVNLIVLSTRWTPCVVLYSLSAKSRFSAVTHVNTTNL